MSQKFFEFGYKAYQVQGKVIMATTAVSQGLVGGTIQMTNALLSKSTWIFAAFVYTAKTGLNYRRYKKG